MQRIGNEDLEDVPGLQRTESLEIDASAACDFLDARQHVALRMSLVRLSGVRRPPAAGCYQPTATTATAQIRWSSPGPASVPFGIRRPPSTAVTVTLP